MKMDLKEFGLWILNNFSIKKDDIKHSYEGIDPESLVIDFITSNSIKRFTVWDDYSLVVESINIDSELTEILKRKEAINVEAVKREFADLYTA